MEGSGLVMYENYLAKVRSEEILLLRALDVGVMLQPALRCTFKRL